MRFLRTASTRRLIAAIAGAVLAIGAGAAIAIAATASHPVPVRKPLAQAIHSALAAPAVSGISARISFTNHLIDSSEIQSSDPLLTGTTGRLWLSSDHRLRLELQGSNGDAQIVVNQRSFWIYDPQGNTVYEGALPARTSDSKSSTQDTVPTVAQIQSNLNQLMAHVNLSGARPTDVAGRPTYTLQVSPKHDGGLLGSVALAWDAIHGVPLRFALYASGQSSPVLALSVTNIHYGPVSASDFATSPPAGAKVVKISTPAQSATSGSRSAHARAHGHAQVTGAAAVAKHLSFKLRAPGKLVGLPRQSVSLLDWGGAKAALLSYGQNLGGIAVIEQPAGASAQPAAASKSGDGQGLSLPTVSIDGATGQELDTAIGTVLHFTRGGVSYTVLGSVPAAAAEAAARAL